MLSAADHDQILDTAFQIIDSSTDTQALFNEACSLSKKIKLDTTTVSSSSLLESFLSVTCQSHFSSDLCFVNAPTFAKKVIEVQKSCTKDDDPLLSPSVREQFSTILDLLKLRTDHTFNEKLFRSMVSRHELPLEMVWLLDGAGALNMDSYMAGRLFEDATFQEKLWEDLVLLCQGTSENLKRREKVLLGFTAFLIRKGFGEGKAAEKKVCIGLIDHVIQGILELNLTQEEAENLVLPTNFPKLEESIPKEILRKLNIHVVSTVLSYKGNVSISECLKTEWKAVQVYGVFRTLYKQLFLPLDTKDLTGILMRHLERPMINGAYLLTFLSVFCVAFPDGAKVLQNLIKSELTIGLESFDTRKISAAFLLARQCAVVGYHSDYSKWFQTLFDGASTSPAATKQTFICLVKFLSSLVPFEAAEHLKAHILKRPSIPPKCKEVYDDYITLAKTRLYDLKVPLTDIWGGIYTENTETGAHSFTVKGKEAVHAGQAEKDVELALHSFAETKKMPTAVIEASIFRRPYFIGKFLPALLTPRYLPDKPDIRMRLIEELKNSGKIPSTLYQQYLENCEKEKQVLLEGVFDVDNDEMEEITLSPSEQLSRRLDKYCQAVFEGKEAKTSESLHAVFESVSGIFQPSKEVTLTVEAPYSVSVSVDLTQCQEDKPAAQVIATITRHISAIIDRQKEQREEQLEDRAGIVKRALQLITGFIHQFPHVTPVLSTYVLRRLTAQKWTKEMHALPLTCLGLMVSSRNQHTELVMKNKQPDSLCVSCTHQHVLTAVCHCLSTHTGGQNVEFILRFLLEYVSMVLGLLDAEARQLEDVGVLEVGSLTVEQLLPAQVVKSVNLLCRRLGLQEQSSLAYDVSLTRSVSLSAVNMVLSHHRWETLCLEHQPTLEEWIELELTVEPTNDCLSWSQRSTSMWEMGLHFMSEIKSQNKLEVFCRELLKTLANVLTKTSSCKSGFHQRSHECCLSFTQLLRRLLQQLQPSNAVWLAETLGPSSIFVHERDVLLRLALDLPPYLMFSNSPHEKITKNHVDCALDVLNHFARSNYSNGAFLSLDVIIYIIQGYLHVKQNVPALSCLRPLEDYPLLSVSIFEHQKTLNEIGLLKYLDQEWLYQLTSAEQWAESVLETGKECADQGLCSDWLKAAALFVACLHRTSSIVLDEKLLKSVGNVILSFLHLTVTYLTKIGYMDKDELMERDNRLVQLFGHIVKSNADLLYHLLNLSHPTLEKLCCCYGPDNQHEQRPLRDLCVLRLSLPNPGDQLLRFATENVTAAVVNVYQSSLEHVHVNGMTCSDFLEDSWKSSLLPWIKSLVDNTSKTHLQEITMCSSRSPGPDLLLCRYIEEKKKCQI